LRSFFHPWLGKKTTTHYQQVKDCGSQDGIQNNEGINEIQWGIPLSPIIMEVEIGYI